jgi:hypothetical protein
MRLEITDKEQEFLLELMDEGQKQLIRELDHTDSRDYKALLTGRLAVLEGLLAKVQSRAIS